MEVVRSLSSVHFRENSSLFHVVEMSRNWNKNVGVLIDESSAHKFGIKFVTSAKYAMEICKFDFVPKFEQVQAIHYLSKGKNIFVHPRTKSLI